MCERCEALKNYPIPTVAEKPDTALTNDDREAILRGSANVLSDAVAQYLTALTRGQIHPKVADRVGVELTTGVWDKAEKFLRLCCLTDATEVTAGSVFVDEHLLRARDGDAAALAEVKISADEVADKKKAMALANRVGLGGDQAALLKAGVISAGVTETDDESTQYADAAMAAMLPKGASLGKLEGGVFKPVAINQVPAAVIEAARKAIADAGGNPENLGKPFVTTITVDPSTGKVVDAATDEVIESSDVIGQLAREIETARKSGTTAKIPSNLS